MRPTVLRSAFSARASLAALLVPAALLLSGGLGAPAFGQTAAAAVAAVADPADLLEEAAQAWQARDVERWTALWDKDARPGEQAFARTAFAADQTTLEWLRRDSPAPQSSSFSADAQVFSAQEPHGLLTYWRLTAERRPHGWVFVSRSDASVVDGFVHMSLSGRAWRAHGLSLRLENFELSMEEGTLFSNPEPLGPTVLVFVGRGRIRFDPAPSPEREQLRRFSGAPRLDLAVPWSFVRLNPDDFARLIDRTKLQPDPDAAVRIEQARRVFAERSGRSFVIDAALPGSPWWLLPTLGDAIVDFPWRRGRVLTFALSASDAEDVNLFDRDRRTQICAYRSTARGREPVIQASAFEVLDQDLAVRFEPERLELTGVHRLRLRSAPATTLRLRLNDDFRVSSVSTGDGTQLLFFRVRGQGSIVVSLGAVADRDRPFTVVTRYAGRHDPEPVDHELLQVMRPRGDFSTTPLVDPPPLVYSNRTAWYPHLTDETFSPLSASFDTPDGWLAVTGGELRSLRIAARRTHAEYRLAQPGKFVTTIIGRLAEVGLRQTGESALRAFSTPRSRSTALAQMRAAEQILPFYAQLFGPCPYPSLSLVAVDAKVPGGHSPPGLVYIQVRPAALRGQALSEDPADFSDFADFFIAHELAHQWFGQGAAPVGYRERWLSEAWAQYAAALWVQQRQGESAFRDMMDRMARWARRHDSAGPIHLGQRVGSLEGDARLYRAVVYDKGACVLHMLRGILGDEAFFAGARAFLARHRFAKVVTSDLREAMEQASGRDLRGFFERWVYETGVPRVAWSAHTDREQGGFETTVTLRTEDAPAPLPLTISVSTSAGKSVQRVVLDAGSGSWTITGSEPPRRVAVDAEDGVLARIKHRSPKRGDQ